MYNLRKLLELSLKPLEIWRLENIEHIDLKVTLNLNSLNEYNSLLVHGSIHTIPRKIIILYWQRETVNVDI